MPSPFPGMDPYLEGAAWQSFHAALIDDMGRQLASRLRPRYVVRVERRFVADGDELSVAESTTVPDVGIAPRDPVAVVNNPSATAVSEPPLQLATALTARLPQRSLNILDVSERRLITAIELLSPSNKRVGGGREEYIERRERFLAGGVHLIEIDLLRQGTRLPMCGQLPDAPYFFYVSRSSQRPLTGIWPITLRQPLPPVPVPLMAGDPDAILDLQAAFTQAYDDFGFDLELDYTQPPWPAIAEPDQAWAAERISGWNPTR